MSDRWPGWANWRNTAYALTFEPAVFVYHKPSFENEVPPSTRAEFVDFLTRKGDAAYGRIGTSDIEPSGVGLLLMSRDTVIGNASARERGVKDRWTWGGGCTYKKN